MFHLARKLAQAALAAVVLSAAFAAPALAQGGVSPRIAVPQQPQIAVPQQPQGPIGYDGCYRVGEELYGPYRMSFCLTTQRGSYRVDGGGASCQGNLSWYRTGNDTIQIDLAFTRCSGGIDWTGDSLACRANGGGFQPPVFPFQGAQNGGGGGNPNARIAVPQQPQIAVPQAPVPSGGYLNTGFRCTYVPAAVGYQPITVNATRSN